MPARLAAAALAAVLLLPLTAATAGATPASPDKKCPSSNGALPDHCEDTKK